MLNQKYSMQWLAAEEASKDSAQFLFFWGHTSNGKVNKACLSQWAKYEFNINGIQYKTAEHWMMAQKANLFQDRRIFDLIVSADNPKEAKKLGRSVSNFEPGLWKSKAYELVKIGNIHKFNQNPEILEYLLSTGESILVEASPDDNIWGIGLSEKDALEIHFSMWEGSNLLGFALMEVRDFFNTHGPFEVPKDGMLPPWQKFPDAERSDLFWRMGNGEDYLGDFSKHFAVMSDRERIIYSLCYPPPFEWEGIYGT
ncbi:NADAR family protein [Leptospira noguchii]|uniref:NADAR family protein n=1 Tax=Leptospira noguchii TaxID=28182 RepID=UPI0002BEFB98|nr:NADAR family protein [Leptospira noguchii]EMO27169.1 PF08719 domain protein [Leptospira interrogans serovar Bataviae str. HAI135]UOG58986.1 NADAR family protein [Leptospira noguchii]